jgi:hypothetical protein
VIEKLELKKLHLVPRLTRWYGLMLSLGCQHSLSKGLYLVDDLLYL